MPPEVQRTGNFGRTFSNWELTILRRRRMSQKDLQRIISSKSDGDNWISAVSTSAVIGMKNLSSVRIERFLFSRGGWVPPSFDYKTLCSPRKRFNRAPELK
ncbi:hypothetical protein CEXT_595471 [Caerostris extrusa]|uniref:Uncharacterized protein n=1 Tax=Caerostris extrusa TaxID=172846 RepID=A0AAV4XYQ3_CAEEX|nr:hypothetical protein CEXT_595471 [Caerostris extrusa]